ncbi:MAG: MmgE/PrpD family protein [Betaproteobacteria bacterium]|nr:MmgE/PrpD family protein [Betaproteobacteria bacterium]
MSTRALARFAANLNYEVLPPAVIERARVHLLDGLGCLLAGTMGGPGRSAADMVAALCTQGGEATVFTGCTRGSPRDAAFVNAMTLYSVGLNDIHTESVSHPGGCIIPVVLATGEAGGARGRDLLVAMIVGYEVMCRIGRAVMPSHRERGFHPTGTCGTFGAAAAASRMMGFGANETANALGIAGSQAAGLFEFHRDGALTMVFHAARAAQNGVEAALLTKTGLTGPCTVLGPTTIAASSATAVLVKRLSVRSPDDVAEVVVRCHAVVARDNEEADPQTLLAARLSMPFNIALVLARGDVVTADLYDADLRDVRVKASLSKVRLVRDDAMPRFGCSVSIRLANGRNGEETILAPRGEASHPLTWNEVSDKFRRLTASVMHAEGVQPVIDAVRSLETNGVRVLAQRMLEGMRPVA